MLAAGASYLSTSADPNLCRQHLFPHLSHHNILARAAAGAGERYQPAWGSGGSGREEASAGSDGGRCAGLGAGERQQWQDERRR